jgi:thioredoxin type arsenate reductase
LRTRTDWLFLCVANSARSQMAEGWARRLAPPGIGVHSAGSDPGPLNPFAVRAMQEVGIDISGHAPKAIEDIPADRIARVVTLCSEEVCPVFPGEVERLHWPLPDPAAVTGSDEAILDSFRSVRDEIERRLRALLSEPQP